MHPTILILDPGQRASIPFGWEDMVKIYKFDKINLVVSTKSLQTLAMRAGYVLKTKPYGHPQLQKNSIPVTVMRTAPRKQSHKKPPHLRFQMTTRP